MSNFIGHAKSLSDGYVYYERLLTDNYYPTLGKYVKFASLRILEQTLKYNQNGQSVRQQAKAEFAKEKELLRQKFQANIDFDYYGDQDSFKQIIDLLNNALNLKEVYERNLQLIKESEGQKAVFSWYPTYFMHAWSEYWDRIKSDFYKEYNIFKDDPGFVLDRVLDKYLPEICVLGIKKMLDGPEVENKNIDPALKDAYKQLINYIGDIKMSGSMANQFYEIYQLDKIKEYEENNG